MNKVVILTGGTSGIGRATVELLRKQGCTVYEFSRRPAPADSWHRSVDVTDGAAVKAAVDAVAEREGRASRRPSTILARTLRSTAS